MSKDPRDPYRYAPPDLTEEERREWFRRQARKFVWGPGDVVITKRGDGKEPKGEDGGKNPRR